MLYLYLEIPLQNKNPSFYLVEKLTGPFHNGEESCRRETCSPQESIHLDEVSESVSGVSGKQCDEVEEWKEIFDNT